MPSTSEPQGTSSRESGRLLVFTLGPRAEARRHPLVPERFRDAEVELRQACLESVIAAGHEAGLPVEVSSPRPFALDGVAAWHLQAGRTFGERLKGAMQAAFAPRPRSPLVVVGSDSPGLGAAQLEAALCALEADPEVVVLGPSQDGGFYLLAAARPLDEALSAVAWCGPSARRTLVEALHRAGRPVVILDPLGDLDEPQDLARFLVEATALLPGLRSPALGLQRLLHDLCRPFPVLASPEPRQRPHGHRRGRAPPFPLAH